MRFGSLLSEDNKPIDNENSLIGKPLGEDRGLVALILNS